MRLNIKKWDRYNNLTILKELEPKVNKSHKKERIFQCKCDCWNIKNIRLRNITNGHTKSCGCLFIKNHTTHGKSYTRIFRVWHWMLTRCTNKTHDYYKYYWGKGITVEWGNFEDFYKDMWQTYKDWLTIERNDNNKNYCKENCCWVNRKQQARNRITNRNYKWKCITEWAEELNISRDKIYYQVNKKKIPLSKIIWKLMNW